MRKQSWFPVAAVMLMLPGYAAQIQTLPPQEKIVIDGKLEEAVWNKAARQSDFSIPSGAKGSKKVKAQTSFTILADDNAVYAGIRCEEPGMAELLKLPENGIWETDGVELFLSPSGSNAEFYQFRVTFGNIRATNFFAEAGNIRPDPYQPLWESAIFKGKDFWSCEIRIPLSAFYMTRQNQWNKEWLLNVARTNRVKKEISSWSPLERSFLESKKYRKMSGFPERKPGDDLFIRSAVSRLTGREPNGYPGIITLSIYAPNAGEFEISSPFSQPRRIKLVQGDNQAELESIFKTTGRQQTRITLKRLADGKLFERFYPIAVEWEPLKIRLSSPEYRNNFYPGQDSGIIAGSVEKNGPEPVLLTLSGPGIETQKITLDGEKNFSFQTPGFKTGKATLTAVYGTEKREIAIRKLAPTGKMMSWISKGNLIIDGKPTLRRNMYAEYYMGGEAFKKKYDADNLYLTKHVKGQKGWLEPARLIRGIEAKEATRDVKPSQELFAKIDETLARNRDRDFAYYYLSDEPECRRVSPVYLKHIYDYIAGRDPYHVIMVGTRAAETFIDCGDWFEVHPYINPRITPDGRKIYDRDIDTLGRFLDEISLKNRPDKCVGVMPTAFNASSTIGAQYPTFAEMVCHTWAEMIHGGKTLYPYAYHDLGDRASVYEGIRYLFSSFAALEDIILHGKRTILKRAGDYEAAVYETPSDRLFVLVNFRQIPVKAEVEGLKGKFFEFRGNRTFSGSRFDLKPLETLVGTSRKRDAGLPSYAETQALIDKMEAERKNRGNLLAGREDEVVVTSSKPVMHSTKMFDGITDVVAWYQLHGEKYYEIAFPKTIPEFTRLRIYGKNIARTVVKIRKRGEWLTLTPEKSEQSEYMEFRQYNSPMRTVKLRLEFPKKDVELYEIELLK